MKSLRETAAEAPKLAVQRTYSVPPSSSAATVLPGTALHCPAGTSRDAFGDFLICPFRVYVLNKNHHPPLYQVSPPGRHQMSLPQAP